MPLDVRAIAVGPIQENCFIVRKDGSDKAVIIDPGDEAKKILDVVDELGLDIEAILLTHCHFDHVGAVAPVAKATGAPVYIHEIETPVLADINSYIPHEQFGPFENYEVDHTLKGGEKLEFAGLNIDVYHTPGHSPGHVTYSIPDEQAICSGDLLFQGSVGRTDLPGGDRDTLLESIRTLTEKLPDETKVYPGHMHTTDLGAEKRTNPFLTELSGK